MNKGADGVISRFAVQEALQKEYMSEQDILFCGTEEELLRLLQEVVATQDSTYIVGIIYCCLQYQYKMVANNDEIRGLVIKEFQQHCGGLQQLDDLRGVMKAFIQFAEG